MTRQRIILFAQNKKDEEGVLWNANNDASASSLISSTSNPLYCDSPTKNECQVIVIENVRKMSVYPENVQNSAIFGTGFRSNVQKVSGILRYSGHFPDKRTFSGHYFFIGQLRHEECGTNKLKILLKVSQIINYYDPRSDINKLKILLEVSQIINYYDPRGFKDLNKISSGALALVYNVCWKNISKYAIKKFVRGSNEEDVINEIHLTRMASYHPNIIKFHGVTRFKDEINYSLVLEYAEGGTLGKYLRNNTKTFKRKAQLKFAKEITNAISWLHLVKKIIHGDLHPNNILIQKDTIKLADFGRSCLKGSDSITEVRGVIPYMDPKFFETQNRSYGLTEKSDIYSLGVILWELTSCRSPFDFETKSDDRIEVLKIKFDILNGEREKSISNTNYKFVALYEKCWRHEPDERPDIRQVTSEINNIELTNLPDDSKIERTAIETTEKLANEDLDLPSDDDCDINSDKYNKI
ncbi:hypothetical protein RclHR1_04050010 [Rhizophagus clarus]|uniref:Kinase-like domain-containing protein n=1 Tax=Rhizophagus clarus TaxID=94130 RepID=A0A2Z6S943_9GLOM|nr:hypothetical protein RclHR1_04050010 [Rhizophagus clarus]GES83778.1 kinase-like domain-containing protein [Rhizophagus clarus]